jgi:hypothetical protein
MAKQLTKTQLKEKAKAYFDAYKKEKEMIATSDGQFFLPKNKSQAQTHASANKLEVYVIAKDEETTAEETTADDKKGNKAPAKPKGKDKTPPVPPADEKEFDADKASDQELKDFLNANGIPFEETDDRAALLAKLDEATRPYPNREPSKEWNVDELKAFLTEKNVKFSHNSKEQTLIDKALPVWEAEQKGA